MTVTMRFSSSRIDDLQSQTSKDDFKNNYEQILLSNMSSNYNNWERYSDLIITIQSWENWFIYSTRNEIWEERIYTKYSDNKQTIINITTDNQEQQKINIKLIPYKIGCEILADNETYSATIIQSKAKNKIHCFKIISNMCKLESIICPQL